MRELAETGICDVHDKNAMCSWLFTVETESYANVESEHANNYGQGGASVYSAWIEIKEQNTDDNEGYSERYDEYLRLMPFGTFGHFGNY